MKALGAEAGPAGSLQVVAGEWTAAEQPPAAPTIEAVVSPDWIIRTAPPAQRRPRPLSPSDLGGAKTLPGEAGNPDALDRGTALHALLEHLPEVAPEARPALAARMLGGSPWADEVTAEALQVITGHADLFALPALTEVTITADLDGQRLLGSIDRLIFAPDGLMVIDYKSKAILPAQTADIPEGIRRQMQAYLQAVAQMHPGQPVRGAILWTREGRLMPCGDPIEAVTAR
jgi:ATP-dependent helicase/nuclease subunit A